MAWPVGALSNDCANQKHPYFGQVIRDETLNGFRGAIRARVAGEEGGADRVGAAVRALVVEARGAAVSVEELVIRIKAEWESLLSDETLARHGATVEIRDRIITSAIRAYYVQ